jgi:2-oxoglutarate ferredoxin oxidoreductase subunit alpha
VKDNGFVPPIGKPLMGAHAMGVGAMVAGLDYFTGYPITPQTELLEYISQALPRHGGVFQQLGDEISSIMAIFGAAACGKRVMTASVGPGLTLMIDGLTNAAGAETPMVVGAITRAHVGVSGGLYPAQSDIRMLKGLGNGDYHLPILAPDSITETAQLTAEAFDLADLYTTPVIVSIDGKMSNMIETLRPFSVPERELPDKSWSIDRPLTEGRRMVAAARFAEVDTMICYELQEKYRVMREREVRFETYLCDDAEVVVVAYGIMARVAREAVRRARAQGVRAGLFRPITIFPFPEDQLGALAAGKRGVLVTEINFGQALVDVKIAAAGRCPIQFIGQPAFPVPADALVEAIHAVSRGEKVRPRTFEDVHPVNAHVAASMAPVRRAAFERVAEQWGKTKDDVQDVVDELLGIRKSTVVKGVGKY